MPCSNQIHKRNSPVLGVERMGGETVDPPLLSHSRDSHRCISPGLGWPHCNTSLPGPMVHSGKKLAHQCARADCCSTHSRTGSGGACATVLVYPEIYGGDASANGFTISANTGVILGFSFAGDYIPSGTGVFIDGLDNCDAIYGLIFSGFGGSALTSELND